MPQPLGFPHGLPPAKPPEDALAVAGRLRDERAPLAAKLAHVAGAVARLPKTRTAPTGGGGTFRYTPVEDMAAAITGLLSVLGVAMLPEEVEPLAEGADWRDASDGKRTRWRYLYRVTWLVTDGTEQLRVQSMGEALDFGDKASNKALTGARKYLYQMLFHLQTGDDPDASHGADDPNPPLPAQRQRRQDRRQGAQEGSGAPSGGSRGPSTPPAPQGATGAPSVPDLSPEDARKVRRRHAAVLAKWAPEGTDEQRQAANEQLKGLGMVRLRDLLDVQLWLKACEAAGLSPSDPLPPDPMGAEAAAAQAARGTAG